MTLFANLFKKEQKATDPTPAKTREDLESTLSVKFQTTGPGQLNMVFTQHRVPQEEEKKLLKDVFDLIASVPQGKKLIDDVAQAGYKLHFDAFRGTMDGCMYGGQKKIMLSPIQHSSIAGLAATALHEMTHAVQNERSGNLLADASSLNIADQIKFQRAAEAAAWTEEAKFAYQIKDTHPEVLKHVSQFPMYHAFASEMEKSGDMKKAGEAAFKSWYDYKHYQDFYEKQHVNNIGYALQDRRKSNDNKALRQSLASQDILNQVFISDDVKQNIEPEFLTQPKAFSISEKGVKSLETQVKLYTSHFFKATKDKSFQAMYSYNSGKAFEATANEPKAAVAASVRPQQSVMASLTAISREKSAETTLKKAALQNKEPAR